MTSSIKVFHVEDYTIMRDGVKYLLGQDPEIEMVGESSTEEGLLEYLKSYRVDVVIMDIHLDGMQTVKATNGYSIAKLIKERYPAIRILAHSAFEDADSVERILTAGASGFVSKKSSFKELAQGVKEVFKGNLFICTHIAGRLKNLNKFLLGIEARLKDKKEIFSTREREILTLLGNGQSSKQISETLFITERTVESHRSNMLQKSETKNTAELIAYGSSLGLFKL